MTWLGGSDPNNYIFFFNNKTRHPEGGTTEGSLSVVFEVHNKRFVAIALNDVMGKKTVLSAGDKFTPPKTS